MNIKNISFTQIKQQFSDSAQKIGSFCGRKVEVLKAKSSETYQATHARVAAFASYSFTKMSSAWNSITAGFKAAKQFVATQLSLICSKISEAASKIFKKKAQEQAAPAPVAPVAEEAPAPEAPEAPAPEAPEAPAPAAAAAEEAPAPAAPAADVSQRGRLRRQTVRFRFDT